MNDVGGAGKAGAQRTKRLAWRALTGVLAVLFVCQASRVPAVRRVARKTYRSATGRHAQFAAHVDVDHFQKGNIHTHSLVSDGKAPIEAMVAWYRDHGYQFAAMTEHNQRVDPDLLAWMQSDRFVLIPGEELTNAWQGAPLHVNALCAREEIGGGVDYERAEDGIAEMFDLVRRRGGVPLLNHPNFRWALDAYQIARGAHGPYLLEVWSGHPDVHPTGDASHSSAEAIWDEVLARGADAAPAAVDDAHELVEPVGQPAAIPGRGWVETFGAETSRPAICAALATGQLYASSGPSLARLQVEGDLFAVGIDDPRAVVTFVGERGEVLATARPVGAPPTATYRLTGGETIVRARVTIAGGGAALTPAYRVDFAAP